VVDPAPALDPPEELMPGEVVLPDEDDWLPQLVAAAK
jgi:hypothetical protein